MKKTHYKNEDKEDDESGGGGSRGEIEFRYKDAMSTGPRDDQLPPEEIRRLLAVHKELHKGAVTKQKQTRQERLALKESGANLRAANQNRLRGGGGGTEHSHIKAHKITKFPQFSGMERKIAAIPSDNLSVTNEKQKQDLENKLENRLENRLQNSLQNQPKFNPKPRPF